MSARTTAATVLLAVATLGSGCGGDTTEPATDPARAQAEQVVESLSPEARELLRRAEELAGRTSATGREYATGDLSPDVASTRFEELGRRTAELGQDARALPESDPAREQVVDLADKTRSTAQELRKAADAGAAPDAGAVEERLRGLKDEGKKTFDRYRDQLPTEARDEISKAVDELISP